MRRIPAALITLAVALGMLVPHAVLAADPAPGDLPDGAVQTADGRILPPLPAGLDEPSIHAEMLSQHADDRVAFQPGGPPSILLADGGQARMAGTSLPPDGAVSTAGSAAGLAASGLPNGLRKEVFGFLPYWMLNDSALASMNYQLVSTIAYFSVNAQKDGDLAKGTSSNPTSGWSGWNSAAMTGVLNRAHDQGVRVVLTVTMMSWDSASASQQAGLLQSATARSRLVSQIVSTVRTRGADGVNLDFEPLATSLRDEYVSFVKQLKRGLVNAGVGDYLTVSVMASAATWATGYDIAGLTAPGAADALFVMGYDYNWSGSSRAGGVAPIQSPYTIDVAGTMADFLTQTSGSRIIWGVPYYGRTWPTKTSSLNSQTLGGGSKAYTYTGHLADAARFGRRWDDVGKVPWYRYWDGAAEHWVQGYYDDRASLGVKYDLINARGFKGTGMWTLLMDQGRDELWRLLAEKFVNDTAAPVGGIRTLPISVDAEATRIRWRASDFASGVSSYDVQWRRSDGSWRTLASRTDATSAWFTGSAGSTYLFRMRARDFKGNVQAWTTVPGKTASLQPGAFGVVSASTLNVRSGPGTSYGVVDSAEAGDVVYVLEGPISANDYQWYRVQYGFSEWPSADYPRIAWMAGSSSGTPMIEPRKAPSATTLKPFVAQRSRTAIFSPNGDGVRDVAGVDYDLNAAASAVRVDLMDARGDVVRTLALGPQPAGTNHASWDGRLTSGSLAPNGRYLARITATDGGGHEHSGPSATFSTAVLDRWGITVDRTAPAVVGTPRAAGGMVAATASVTATFSEPVSGLDSDAATISVDGRELPATISAQTDRRGFILRPSRPLPTDVSVQVTLDSSVRDAAGNAPSPGAWTFTTAPGQVFVPSRGGSLLSGTRTAFAIAPDGDLLRRDVASLAASRQVSLVQRATLRNLPGSWLNASSGPLAGGWMRESARQHLYGAVSRHSYSTAQSIRLRRGTHAGYRFASDGAVAGRASMTLARAGWATSTQRAVINGSPYWRIDRGALDGYWIAESAAAYRPGKVERRTFHQPPRVDVARGTYTAYRYDWRGRRSGSLTVTVGSTTAIRVSGWAIINGTPHYLVSTGPWAGRWLAETSATPLHV